MIGETEMVLEYQVYLSGSLEGALSPYTTYYDTNEEAVLGYVNYLGNDCYLSVDPPKFPWGDTPLDYPPYPQGGSVKPDKVGTTTEEEFLQTGVANVQLSATGIPLEQGVDLIVVMDLSGSMEKGVDSNANPEDYKETRIYAMEESLKNMVAILKNSGADVRIAMSDFGDLDSHEFAGAIADASNEKPFFDVDYNNGFRRANSDGYVNYSEFSNYLNFPMKTGDNDATAYTIANSKFNLSNPSYTGKVIPTVYTGSGQVNAGAFVPVEALDDAAMNGIIEKLNENVQKSYGTNYDLGLEYAYQLGHAIRQQNQANGEDRKQVCIFLSDGAATQYNYFSGRPYSTTWADWLTGNTDGIHSVDRREFDDEIDALGAALLHLMKNGSLLRPEFARDSGRNIDGIRYFRYYPDKENATAEHFYTVMDGQGWDLDWEYLCEIAEANGLTLPDYESDPDGYWEKMKLPEFRKLLVVDEDTALKTYTKEVTDEAGNTITVVDYYASRLKMPDSIRPETYKAKHGNAYTGTKTDFFDAYQEYTGTALTYDRFAKIAYANRKLLDANGVAVGQHLQNLLTELRTTDGYETLSPYAYFYNADGKNWWAEAIKGDPDQLYPVINKYAMDAGSPFAYNGDVKNRFSGATADGLALKGRDYISGFRGLGMDLYTISFSMAADSTISSADAETVLRNIATGQSYFFAANSAGDLDSALKAIVNTLSHTATRAWFQDTMGDDYDLSTKRTVVNEEGLEVTVNADPHIRIMEFALSDGVRTGEPNVWETVHFNADPNGDGTTLKAWSDQVYTTSIGEDNKIVVTYTDIWGSDGVIRGKYFYYNTNSESVRIDMTGDGEEDYALPAETFLWIIGVIGETEMVMEYQAYLTGSVEGTRRTNGVKKYYDTNEEATLTYINYLGNSCRQSVPSPKYPWITNSDSGLVTDKHVEATEDDPNAFTLTLEAYAKDFVRDVVTTKPADIVLVLDHSGSMRTPVGAPGVLESRDRVLYTGGGAIDRGLVSTEKGSHTGYYVCQSTSTKTWFVMRFDKAENKWYGYSVPSTESIVDIRYQDADDARAKGGYTEHTQTQSWAAGTVPQQLVFYKSQYAVLYDALQDFVEELKDSGAEHNVSIIGFAGSQGHGSRLYVGGSEDMVKTYNAMYNLADETRRTELYQTAPKNVQNADDYAQLLRAIESIETNHSFTCPTAGLRMASDLFRANAVDLEQRDRIVVLFTDGIPNRKLGEEEISEAESKRTGRQTEIYDEIVRTAYETKNTYGAQVYTICTTTLAGGSNGENRTFLNYSSSNYPDAVSYSASGTAASTGFFHTIHDFDTLNDVFSTITQSTIKSSTELDETAILKELLTDYFVLDEKADYQVKAYTAPYLGTGSFDDPASFGPMKELQNAVALTSSDGSGRKDVISVTGYDYKDEYLSGVERTVNGQPYYGSKLVVKVKVRTRDGFWGGNNVPTNKNDTAIYTPDTTDGNGNVIPGTAVEYFPRPEVNVPIDVTVTARDKTIYYGGDLDSDKDNFTGDELLSNITAGGKPVAVVTTTNPDGSTSTSFVPEAGWMDDFADMSWTGDSTTITDDLRNTQPDDYTYGVTVTPKYDGVGNKQPENPGNLAGNVDGGTVETAPPRAAGSDTARDTGHVYILVPEITFKDSVTEFGTDTGSYNYELKDLVSTEWVFMEDSADTANAPGAGCDAPKLEFAFNPENGVAQFVGDTKVDVSVSVKDSTLDISAVTTNKWENCAHKEHGQCGSIGEHTANESGKHEFWVHVTLSILPDTVVIDFGLPVDIDPLVNDLHGVANVTKKLIGIGSDFQTSKDFTYGDAEILEGSQWVRYSLHISNGMQMDKEETFDYRGEYTLNGKAMTAESTITVIPATVIYYEDSFVTYTDHGAAWSAEGTLDSVQDTDRPGADQIGRDLNNIYGYDSHYVNENGYSMDTYHKITVSGSNYGKATFTFTGTAFDVIALSSSTTGAITVSVYPAGAEQNRTNRLCSYVVDTYYGYKPVLAKILYTYTYNDQTQVWYWKEEVIEEYPGGATRSPAQFPENPTEGATVEGIDYIWVITDPTNPNALYQVPVMKVDMADHVSENNGYGTYTAVITVAYDDILFDHGQYDSCDRYDFMLDAIRIYDQANDGENSQVIEDAYKADGEGWPTYTELRDILIAADTFDSLNGNDEVSGIVFIDGIPALDDDTATGAPSDVTDNVPGKTAAIVDYANFGPNNELYLAPGQGVAFRLDTPEAVQNVHLALKSVGGTANVMVYAADEKNVNVLTGDSKAFAVNTATDLYYSISALKGKTVIIRNVSGQILSVTNIKMTYSSDPRTANLNQQDMFRVSYDVASAALAALKPAPVNPFADIFKGDYYYDPILWAVENGITNGVDASHFGPAAVCNRAQVVTFLWRAAGCPEPNASKHPFVDVEADSFYYKAMLWAVENGITNGVDATHFAPNGQCNRAQVVTFLWRAKGCPEPVVTEHPFADVEEGSFYHKATLWAVENGITNGMSANSFAPALTCTRGQVVTFLYRASEK